MRQLHPESLALETAPDLQAGPGQVRIAVAASGVNRADLSQRQGHYGPPPGVTPVMGLEVSGQVDAVGEGVTRWHPGDEVCALLPGGGYAEQVVCPESHILPIPAGVSLVDGAALPEVYATAWLNLFGEGALQTGERVVVHAAGSGVGIAALQLCGQFDNPTFATAGRADKLERATSLGATGVWNRHDGSFASAVRDWGGADVILDPVGGSYLEDNLRVLHRDGRLIIIAFMGGRTGSLDFGRLLVKRLRVVGSTLRSRSDSFKTAVIADLHEHVWPLIGSGAIEPVIDSRYPVAQADEAHAHVAGNASNGKVLLTW